MWRKQVVASESTHPCRLSSLNLPAVQPPAQAPCAPPHLVTNLVDEQALNLRGGCRIDLQPACVCRGDVTAQHLLTNCDDTVQLRQVLLPATRCIKAGEPACLAAGLPKCGKCGVQSATGGLPG